MGERTFGALFAPYLPADEALSALAAGEIENMDDRPLLTDDDIQDIKMKIDALSVERDKLLIEDNGYRDI